MEIPLPSMWFANLLQDLYKLQLQKNRDQIEQLRVRHGWAWCAKEDWRPTRPRCMEANAEGD